MIHPSYTELMNVVNTNVNGEEEPVVNSRYSIVIATAKRARQLINGGIPHIEDTEGKKPLSIAVEELGKGEIHILSDENMMKREKGITEETIPEESIGDDPE